MDIDYCVQVSPSSAPSSFRDSPSSSSPFPSFPSAAYTEIRTSQYTSSCSSPPDKFQTEAKFTTHVSFTSALPICLNYPISFSAGRNSDGSSASSTPQSSSTAPSAASGPSSPQFHVHGGSPTSTAFVTASGSPFLSPPLLSSPLTIRQTMTEKRSHHADLGCLHKMCNSSADLHPGIDSHSVHYKMNPDVDSNLSCHHVNTDLNVVTVSSLSTLQNAACGSPYSPSTTCVSKVPILALPSSSTYLVPPGRCDVYIGVPGSGSSLTRFSNWLRAELELQGISCSSVDRANLTESHSHNMTLHIITSCTFGVVIITRRIFSNRYSMQELQIFLRRKNLVPLYFDIAPGDCSWRDIVEKKGAIWERYGGELWRLYGGEEKDWIEVLVGLSKVDEWKLEAHNGDLRDCILKTVSLLGSRLGRRSMVERVKLTKETGKCEGLPFPRNVRFLGREKEMKILDQMLNGDSSDMEDEKQQARTNSASRRGLLIGVDSWQNQREFDGRATMEWETSHSNGIAAGLNCAGLRDTCSAWDTRTRTSLELNGGICSKQRCRSSRHFRRRSTCQPHRRGNNIENANIDISTRGGLVCIIGEPGIGKTELALEYAYRVSQQYKMVLWIGGESHYFRQNYLSLCVPLALDIGIDSQKGLDQLQSKAYDEHEMEALHKVKRELERDIPYLLVIDNVDSEYGWQDGKNLAHFLPQASGATRVIVTSQLPKLMNCKSLALTSLTGTDTLTLMKGASELPSHELIVLRRIEEMLGSLTLGLHIVGGLISELKIMPSEIFHQMEAASVRDLSGDCREEESGGGNFSLMKLLDTCFFMLGQHAGVKGMCKKMAWVGGYFAPQSIPIPLLAVAASKYPTSSKDTHSSHIACFGSCSLSRTSRWPIEAGALLVRLGLARSSNPGGSICFHNIVQSYARKRSGVEAVKAMVQALTKKGNILLDADHFWAACIMTLGLGNNPIIVKLNVVDMVFFIEKGALQLAKHAYTSFSRLHAALELLRMCTAVLEDVEKFFIPQSQDREMFVCWRTNGHGQRFGEDAWREVILLKALLLHTQSMMMLKGGQFDAGEELCRSCIGIRTVMLGKDHHDTLSAQETLARLVRSRSHSYNC